MTLQLFLNYAPINFVLKQENKEFCNLFLENPKKDQISNTLEKKYALMLWNENKNAAYTFKNVFHKLLSFLIHFLIIILLQ